MDHQYFCTTREPVIKTGTFSPNKGVEVVADYNCFPLGNNAADISYLLEIWQESNVVVSMRSESLIKREDGGEVERKQVIAALQYLVEDLNLYCEKYMKAKYNYTFSSPIKTPARPEVETIISRLFEHRHQRQHA